MKHSFREGGHLSIRLREPTEVDAFQHQESPLKSLPLGCDGAQQKVRFLPVPMGTLQLSLHSEIQASEGKSGHEAFL